MNNSDGFSSYSNKYSNVGNVDQIVHKLNERYAEQASDLEALRDRNDQLMALLAEQKKRLDFEAQKREELHSKIVKITDENWAKDLEIAHMRELDAQSQSELKNLADQGARQLRDAKQAHLHELEALQETNLALNEQLKRSKTEMSALNTKLIAGSRSIEILNHSISNKDNDIARIKHESEQALAGLRVRHDGEIQQSMANEAKQNQLIEGLQTSLAQLKKQLSETQARSHEEIAKSFAEFELFKKHMTEQASRFQAEHGEQIEQASQLIAAFELERDELRATAEKDAGLIQRLSKRDAQLEGEISELKRQLGVLTSRAESDARNIQNWQAQLSQREQMLVQTSDSVNFEKTSLIRLAMKLSAELNMARTTHPLKDYIGVIETELASLQQKLKQMPSQYLDRVKIVEGFKQVVKKRDFLHSILTDSQKQLEERAGGIMAALVDPSAQEQMRAQAEAAHSGLSQS